MSRLWYETHTELTHEEIAAALGISRSRVGALERKALRKCRAWALLHGVDLRALLAQLEPDPEPTRKPPLDYD